MKIRFWGTRGSLPSSRPDTQIFGGHTSCITITSGDHFIILDAGSGIQLLDISGELFQYRRIDILLTHLHMDHIQGLGFFQPLFQAASDVHIWGPAGYRISLYERLNRYLSPPLFPVPIRDLPCKLTFHEVPTEPVRIGSLNIEAAYICHPRPPLCHPFNGNKTFTYSPDHEPALGWDGHFPLSKEWTSGFELARNADLLVHDAQYSADEYKTRIGWGHSTYEHALKFAELANARHLSLFHHDPTHSDDDLYHLFQVHTENKGYNFEISIAREGDAFQF